MEEKLDLNDSGGSKKGFGLKVILIGLPLFIIQLVLVYFITANLILNKEENDENGELSDSTNIELNEHVYTSPVSHRKRPEIELERGKFFYTLDDVVVNPAGTGGKKLMMISMGFDLQTAEEVTIMETREFMVKDAINSVLSSKTLGELTRPGAKKTLKVEIIDKLREVLPEVELNNVYFAKFIIQ